jgi:hypothetical protein
VRVVDITAAVLGCAALVFAGCTQQPAGEGTETVGNQPARASGPTRIEAGEGAAKRIQAALINAKPGDVIELGAGRFDCRATLSLDVSGVIVRGQGPDRTILTSRIASTHHGVMMPELGKRLVHEEGVALARRWIAAMVDPSAKSARGVR